MGDDMTQDTTTTVLVQLGQAELANYSYSHGELSYVSAKLYRSRQKCRLTVHCTWRDLSRVLASKTAIACNNATDIELRHDHTYAVGVADIAAREGSPHNVLHSSSIYYTDHRCVTTQYHVCTLISEVVY